jgi:dihydroorotate dehydrogenase (NAD+) catalytic subunit
MPQTLTASPIYDIHKTYLENADQGPFFSGHLPQRQWKPESEWIDFLGYKIASPVGVPAGPLLNSKWTTLAARLGFDVVTYKTIRSYEHPSHPLPNVLFVDTGGAIAEDRIGAAATPLGRPLGPSDELAITNSFGNPSRKPEYLEMDIHLAAHALEKGQVLIVSVFGTGDSLSEAARGFIKAASLAKSSGAHVIEANFSCPNVSSGGALYADPEASYQIAKEIAEAIKPTPLIVKMGVFKDQAELEAVLLSLAKAGVRAVCGINTIPMNVVDAKGNPALGEDRLQSGICGDPIRPMALSFIKHANAIIDNHGLELELLGCGGITKPKHFDQFLEAGAGAALSATGMMWDPYLASRWHTKERQA